jgi:membrane-associated phospholipid phosphatase
MDTKFTDWTHNWKKAWDNKYFRIYFPIITVAFVVVILIYGRFLDFIELRSGSILQDPVLNSFEPKEVTWYTFGIIYISVIMVLFHLSWQPVQLLIAFQAYIFIALARMLSMYLTPLDPPPLLIPLEDPFVQSVSSGVLTRDLFFSGHTSTLFLLFLSCTGRKMKVFFLICTILVGILVLVQHVHYSIDVVAAPFYAYTCYKLSSYFALKVLGDRHFLN